MSYQCVFRWIHNDDDFALNMTNFYMGDLAIDSQPTTHIPFSPCQDLTPKFRAIAKSENVLLCFTAVYLGDLLSLTIWMIYTKYSVIIYLSNTLTDSVARSVEMQITVIEAAGSIPGQAS